MVELIQYCSEIVVDALFPHSCVCGKWGAPICTECLDKAKVPHTDLCPFCKKISEFGRTCPSCRYKTELTGVMIVGTHEGVLKDAIWRLKYGSVKDISTILGKLAAGKYGEFLKEKRFAITSTPITEGKRKWRGYNQAEEIAKVVSAKMSLPYVAALRKIRDTGSQVGRSRKERLLNMKNAFEAVAPAGRNKKILVIDDVYTSGATLEEAARALRAVGYREVWGLVITRD